MLSQNSTIRPIRTLLKVVGFAHVDADQCHELQLRQALARRLRQRQQIAQIRHLRIDQIASQLGGAFGRFVGVEPVYGEAWIHTLLFSTRQLNVCYTTICVCGDVLEIQPARSRKCKWIICIYVPNFHTFYAPI